LGHVFADPALLLGALTHASAMHVSVPRNAERLEFLGDAVVGLALSEMLIRHYPDHDEGALSKFRAALVNTASLAAKAQEVGLDRHVTLGKGEEKSGGRRKASILAATYEAVIGAVFLDAGFDRARAVIGQHFAAPVEAVARLGSGDAKTQLQELCQALHRVTPTYRLVDTAGPDHARHFIVVVVLNDVVLGRGEGRSKRAAEQAAAGMALAHPHLRPVR
jgi:ribonuclease-3